MAVYYRYKSERDFDSIDINVPFISIGSFKQRIFESARYGWGKDFDLAVINAHTNEEYLDEAMLIPKYSSVLIRRLARLPRMAVVADRAPVVENTMVNAEPEKSSLPATVASTMIFPDDSEWNGFWNDVNGTPEVPPVQSSNPTVEAPPTNIVDEESKIKALIDTPALDWQCHGPDGFGPSRGFERGIAGKMGGHGFGFEWKTPPQGYVCHRCKVPGHFIQHCPTNGDAKFDIIRAKPPNGSYTLSSGAVALKPNDVAFEKEVDGGVPSTCSVGELPPELHCRLCKKVMKDAVLSKCCFESFCNKCISDHIISKTRCVCGKKNVLADDLLPNKTLRHTINRILEGGNSSSETAGSTFAVRDMESDHCLLPKVPSPTSLGSALLAEEEVHQKVPTSEAGNVLFCGKKKEKNKARMPANDLQWKTSEDLAAENNMMPSGPSAFNPYWTGMQPGMDGCLAPYPGAMPYMGYGILPFDMAFGGIVPQDPFGAQGYMFPSIPPQRYFGGVVNRVADVPSIKFKCVCLLYCTNFPLPSLFLYCCFMKGRDIVLLLLLRLNNRYFRSWSPFVFSIYIFNDAPSNYGVIMGRECQNISNFDFSIYAYLAIKCTCKVDERQWF
ncbi:E3 ubiquitin ligase PQT3-like isoform X3 [Alnus glutinosa]|uniref:E3 ubiquitin ligase PQT3-like isoform X3 n=1 Tax=Alnus glutinosa TaxID=3517 RepID=UPI002D771991|nr:E3 ubiquitin ligase PQT3-like isoform X3 [Alnus glutinosa]